MSAKFDFEAIASRGPTMWRYAEALPVEPLVTLGEGMTPLVRIDGVYVKIDYLFPTGSYKDRGAAVLISYCKQQGIESVVEDSSGNAGSAIAAYCAAAGIACEIFVPASTSPGKLAQIERYGAKLTKVNGTRADTAAAARIAAETTYYASHVHNDYFLQGTKTWAFEVCEQLGWRAPDTVVLPVGNGSLLLGVHRGFCELRDAGVIEQLPRIVGVRVEDPAHTIAEGIAIVDPPRGAEIEAAADEWVVVNDEQIIAAMHDLGRCGHYVEPTGASAFAALERINRDAVVVTSLTGHGLKAV